MVEPFPNLDSENKSCVNIRSYFTVRNNKNALDSGLLAT